MDVISYGAANKADKQEKYTRNDILGQGVEGTFPHVKDRIDKLEQGIQSVVAQADKLIVNDTINIMKAHAQLNAVAKSMKYKMYNMIFDDLLDLSGIDTTKSSGFVHDATNGLVKASDSSNYTIVTTIENTDVIPEKVVLVTETQLNELQSVLIDEMNTNNWSRGSVNGDFWLDNYGTGTVRANYLQSWTYDPNYDYQIEVRYNILNYGTNYYASLHLGLFYIYYHRDNGSYIQVKTDSGWVRHDITTKGNNTWKLIYRQNKTYEVYKNDVLIASGTISGLPTTFTSSFWHETNNEYVQIDYIRIYKLVNQTVNGAGTGSYSISRNGGITFESIIPETLFYFTNKSPADNKLVLKAELPANIELLNYAITWT